MKTTLAIAAVAMLLATPGLALAGGYVSAGIGSDADLGGDFATHFSSDDHRNGRVALGHRSGPLAIEGTYFGTGLSGSSPLSGYENLSTHSLGVNARLILSLLGPIEGYVHGGLNQTWLRFFGDDDGLDHSGRGYLVGGGLQVTFEILPLVDLSLWADYTHQSLRLTSDRAATLDGSIAMVNLGLTLGSSF